MAQEPTDSGAAMDTLPDAPAETAAKAPVRSFKKKYAKMKIKFELGNRENENLIREELRIEDLSKRIQEQNDQLLEVLLEFNESLQVSPAMRYDLNMPDDIPSLPAAEEEIPPFAYRREPGSEIMERSKGRNAYRQVEQSIKRNKEFAPAIQYSTLSKIPHTPATAADVEKITDGVERRLGYFTPEHETEYYLALDAKLGDEAAALQLERIPDPPTFAEREKDANMRNPASVQNWLRRNQPQNLQEHEVASEKSASRPSNQRSSKRAPTQRKDDETIDEDGMDAEPTPKNKRKRDEDTGYRPKGGSSRSKKKKEESTPTANRNGKKT
ncbi:hypothetical protein N7450_009773 [Penicillium hetheringtonii]|uniref:IEC3 subunit of the Ino80 complex, chromatin re-modelling-domain-containing protein n=1 Tax=Penicillium hetheringtonii TaxID=911720 RepID=A0AAD6DBV2_9EURO|nr:hypothetical protein N7450_009773 [Penicillium hetheringtonii]